MTDLFPFIVIGLTTGSVYGLAGTGLVLTFKTSGIFNFAQGATAAAAAYMFYELNVNQGLSWGISAVVSVGLLGPAFGLLLAYIARSVARQGIGLQVVATLGIILIVEGLATIKYGDQPLYLPQYLPNAAKSFELAGVSVTYGQATIAAISLAAVLLLSMLFRWSRTGTAMRAVVDDPDLVALHGMRPHAIQRAAWIIGSTFAAMSGVLIAPSSGIQAVALTFLVVQAFGAAAVGAFSNIPLTYVGGLLIGVLSSISTQYVLDVKVLTGLPASLPFIFLFVALIMIPTRRLAVLTRPATPPKVPWMAPPRLRIAAAIPVFAFLGAVPLFAGVNLPFFTTGLSLGIIILSLGLLVRTAGIVSLCHAAFAAVGAVAYSQLVIDHQVPTVLALLFASLIVVPVAALLAIPAIRLSGLFLALATLGFGLLMEQMIYPLSFMFTTDQAGRAMPRPSFAASDDRYYYYVLICFAVVALFITLFHMGRFGRLLRGMGASAIAIRTLGADLNVTRLLVFCISGFIAAMGGILYGGGVNFAVLGDPTYSAFYSLVLVAMLAVMPFREPWYAVVAGVGAVVPAYWLSEHSADWLNVLFGVFAVILAMQGGAQSMPEKWRERLVSAFPWRPGPDRGVPLPRMADSTTEKASGTRAGLEVEALTVRYGGNVALADLDLSAPIGLITGVIGPNGAGKTTLFNTVSGLVKASEGKISFAGMDVTRLDPSRRARSGIGRTFQTMQLCEELTVNENVMLGFEAGRAGRSFARQLWAGRAEREAGQLSVLRALDSCDISHLRDLQVNSLSTGQRRLVEVARCLAGDFSMLLLDEPSSGLDSAETARLADLLVDIVATRGCGILLVEHDMSLVLKISARVFVLDFGELIFSGTPGEIRTSSVVRSAYLGTSELISDGAAGETR